MTQYGNLCNAIRKVAAAKTMQEQRDSERALGDALRSVVVDLARDDRMVSEAIYEMVKSKQRIEKSRG